MTTATSVAGERTMKRILLKVPGELCIAIEDYRRRPSPDPIPDRQATILHLIRRGIESERELVRQP